MGDLHHVIQGQDHVRSDGGGGRALCKDPARIVHGGDVVINLSHQVRFRGDGQRPQVIGAAGEPDALRALLGAFFFDAAAGTLFYLAGRNVESAQLLAQGPRRALGLQLLRVHLNDFQRIERERGGAGGALLGAKRCPAKIRIRQAREFRGLFIAETAVYQFGFG